jgi:predicted fused transcriptional regulator/phosphomethylpyrimidine kinase/predicted transcriptional regulator
MSLVLPSEIVVERVLPTLRGMLATELTEQGLTQQQVASHLGVTQAAVSKYTTGDPDLEPVIAEDPRCVATVERIAEGLASEEMDSYEALRAVLDLIETFEDRGPICELHEEAMPGLQGLGCDLCVRGGDDELEAERAALASTRKAARVLAASGDIAPSIPNVGANAGTAVPGAADATDVAAIPGRIYTVGGRVEVPADPEFGASEHVATAVLAAMTASPPLRGAVNLATDDGVIEAARSQGLAPVEFDATYEDRAERLRTLLADNPDCRVAYHRGAFGIEPITYVFGETAVEAAERAVALVERRNDG